MYDYNAIRVPWELVSAGSVHDGAFRLQYQLGTHGWAVCRCTLGIDTFAFDASYLSDPVEGMAYLVSKLLWGTTEGWCAFEDEPGLQLLAVRVEDSRATVGLFHHDDQWHLFDETDLTWELLGIVSVPFSAVITTLSEEVRRIYKEVGPSRYEAKWCYPFPMKQYMQMEQALRQRFS